MNAFVWLIEKDLNPTLLQRLHEALTRRGFLTGLGAAAAVTTSVHKAIAPENKKGDYQGSPKYSKKWENLSLSNNIEDRRIDNRSHETWDDIMKKRQELNQELTLNKSSNLSHKLGIEDMRTQSKWPKGPGKSTPRKPLF